MDQERKAAPAVQPLDTKQQRRQRQEPAEPHTASPPAQSLRGNQCSGDQSSTNGESAAGRGEDVTRSHGYSSRRRVRNSRDDVLQRDRSSWEPHVKSSQGNHGSPGQGRVVGKTSLDAQNRGFRGGKSASTKPVQTPSAPFEVKMTDFPELAGGSLDRAGPPPLLQKDSRGLAPPSASPQTQSASSWKSIRRGSPTQYDHQKIATDAKSDSTTASPGQLVVTSWANVASQPPKKPVPKEKTASSCMQMDVVAGQQEEGAPGKKKRKKKKKKAKDAGEDVEAESAEPATYQQPPKFEDEEEFPGLTPAPTDRLITHSYAAKLCNEEKQREGFQKSPAAKCQPTESKKGQKAEKGSGKKSKAPVQLDIGNMLAVLEKKQFKEAKQDSKPVTLSVGGGLPVVQKQPLVQKKPPWQQDKIAHNPLDSTSPLVKKGKQREVPKAKKPTALKKVILKEREERKQRRLLEERGLLPEDEIKPNDAAAEEEEEQCDGNDTASDEVGSPTEELDDQSDVSNNTNQAKEDDEEAETDKMEGQGQQIISPSAASRPKIHSRKFRDYCSQMLSKDVDECATTLLKELVRFQDRLYQKDPMKARMKRRIVMGLREVLKHLKLRKVKCVVISPNCERIQSKGGLDEALYTIIDTCREQGVPFVFALSRKALGRCVNKAVPVSLVGIFNYDGAQDYYHKMIELSSEARKAYEVMVSSQEQPGQTEAEEAANTEEELQISSLAEEAEAGPDSTQPEEPEYIKIWKKMVEKEWNHKFLNFEEQLSSMRLDSECTENTEKDEKS